ncbi:protein FRA10AC1 [Phlebotomus papatasi]|uniref:protein FRA10AC1 n=1 Tax=Phlebotomus papatasi TaxID=29031 RepID=UPI002483E971|nr:protein FRA10AC1 [Phlebotomus papatasi]
MTEGIFKTMDRYQLHRVLMAEIEKQKQAARRGKTDLDVIRENHQFLWDENEKNLSWERQLAKSYYSKLFREYCICDLSQYKKNQVGLRWRTENEIVMGKGQFICGNKHCREEEKLVSWEVNFNYIEHGQKKTALVKVRLCPECSHKLNYHTKKRLAKRKPKRLDISSKKKLPETPGTSKAEEKPLEVEENASNEEFKETEETGNPEENIWAAKDAPVEDKTREDEFNEYLEDLLL